MNYEFRITNKTKAKLLFVLLISLFTIHYSLFTQKAIAQSAISLSVTPPLFELVIQPGKEIKQTYTITNNGEGVILIPKIVYFTPADNEGNIDLSEDLSPDWVKYTTDPIQIKSGKKTDFNVIFSPPKDAQEIDHFLTLIFETKEINNILNQNSTSFASQIGTNILLTISKDGNPKKSAEIVEFTAPKVVDSLLGRISYLVILKNNGNSFWKPIGKIITKNEVLKLAPQNIISGSNRKISCLNNENLINCELSNKFIFGKIISRLEFSTDDNPIIYKKETVTYAFPFTLIGIISVLLIIYQKERILNLWRKRK